MEEKVNKIVNEPGPDVPNETTAAAIEEGRRIASDTSVKGFSGIDDLRKALEV